MDEFKEYFIDHAKIVGIPDDKFITEWTEEETQRWSQSIKDNPGKFIKDTPQEVKDNYKYRLSGPYQIYRKPTLCRLC